MKTKSLLWATGFALAAVGHGFGQPIDTNWPRPQLKAIASGGSHSLALKTNGSLWVWGNNDWGELGIGSPIRSTNVPVRVGTGNDWIAVSAMGGNCSTCIPHNLALQADGSLWAWGGNWFGQLGIGSDVTSTNVPVRVGSDFDWAVVAAGASYSLALKADGSLWAWGANFGGQLGIGSLSPSWSGPRTTIPVRVGTDYDWVAIAAGPYTCDEFCIGVHSLALKADGSLWAWGGNDQGQLGIGLDVYETNTSMRVGMANDWSAMAAGGFHTVALKTDGSLWTWGANNYAGTPMGQLGIGTNVTSTNVPVRVGMDNDWADIAADIASTMALKTDGSLWGWGYLTGSTVPTRVGTDMDFTTLALGYFQWMALKQDGSLWMSGARVGSDNDWGVPLQVTDSGPFRITSLVVGNDGRFRLTFTLPVPLSISPSNRVYYVLYRGAEVTNIHTAVSATLGNPRQLIDPIPVSSNATAFYRVAAVSLAQPLDLDGDGIDDVYELRHPLFLDSLNAADATGDYDGDGDSNLREYLNGTDPESP